MSRTRFPLVAAVAVVVAAAIAVLVATSGASTTKSQQTVAAASAISVKQTSLGPTLVDETYHYAMDYELWLRLGRDHRFARLNRIVGIDRNYPGRKSVTVTDDARAEMAKLRATYGATDFSPPVAIRAGKRAIKIAIRLMGVTLVPKASDPLAFNGSHDGLGRLAFRQVAVSRARMMAREQRPV